jgi:hypothetical protein
MRLFLSAMACVIGYHPVFPTPMACAIDYRPIAAMGLFSSSMACLIGFQLVAAMRLFNNLPRSKMYPDLAFLLLNHCFIVERSVARMLIKALLLVPKSIIAKLA